MIWKPDRATIVRFRNIKQLFNLMSRTQLYRNCLTLLFFFAVVGISVAEEMRQEIPQPKVDERVELLGIVFRLAGASEYECVSFKEYDDAINQHFGPFKNHPVILAAQSLRSKYGVSYDAVMSYAVHISIENGRVVFPDENTEKTLSELDPRWNRKEAQAQTFAKQLDDFYVKSRFHEFFEAHHEMYLKTEEKIKAITDKIDYSWFQKFYGDANLERFRIVPSCISEQGNYGSRCHFKDGSAEYFAIVCTRGPDADYNENSYIPLIIHEFSHSFCNPLVAKYLVDLRPAVKRVWPFVEVQMTMQAYGSPDTLLYEYLVRACEIRYQVAQGNENEAKIHAWRNRNLGFLWIVELVRLLGRYEKERDKYPMLDDFMPEIVKMQNALVTDEYVAQLHERSPQIVAMNPPNGAKDVDLNFAEISITFDRSMGDGMMWFTRNTHSEPYPNHDAAVWSDDHLTCTGRNVGPLEPGTTYHIWFNYKGLYGFRCANGIPLKPVHYTFTTKAEVTETTETE